MQCFQIKRHSWLSCSIKIIIIRTTHFAHLQNGLIFKVCWLLRFRLHIAFADNQMRQVVICCFLQLAAINFANVRERDSNLAPSAVLKQHLVSGHPLLLRDRLEVRREVEDGPEIFGLVLKITTLAAEDGSLEMS